MILVSFSHTYKGAVEIRRFCNMYIYIMETIFLITYSVYFLLSPYFESVLLEHRTPEPLLQV